jgi:hypothetical protein
MTARTAVLIVACICAAGCRAGGDLERLITARGLAAEILVQFTKAADAANRAVMADTDETSTVYAREAEQAGAAVEKDSDLLAALLRGLGFSNESTLLNEFRGRYAEYRALDRSILALAVENTNLKAQRLSFGPGRTAADEFRDSLQSLAAASAANRWQMKALAATALADARNIEALQGPHIAEADPAVMTGLEQQMAASEASARGAMMTLAGLIQPAARARLEAAAAAFDRFMKINSEIVALSRRNTNVRSLALSLNQKGILTARCQESLRALVDALANHRLSGTR